MNKFFRLLMFSFLVYFISACAQVGSLTGGDKDTIPPKLILSKPDNKSLNFIDNKIVFTFDEFIINDNLESKFISSPYFETKPSFKTKRKKVIISFNEKLKDSVTYFLYFDNGIKDYHEGNSLNNFSFVISTGNFLDTLEISGKIEDAYLRKPETGFYVILYKDYADSVPLIQKPYYITKTDSSGNFKFDYLKKGQYKLFGLNDLDLNYLFNLPNEKISFYDSLIIPGVERILSVDSLKKGTVLHKGQAKVDTLKNDTVISSYKNIWYPTDLKLVSFKEDKQKQFVSNYERTNKGKCVFKFNKPIGSLLIKGSAFDLNSQNSYIEYADTGKVATVWIKDVNLYNKDTLKFDVKFYNKDSLENLAPETTILDLALKSSEDEDSLNTKIIDSKNIHNYYDNFALLTETPIQYFDTSKIKLFRVIDTSVVDTKTQRMLSSQRRSPDVLFFAFARPLVKELSILQSLDSDTIQWCKLRYSKNRDTVYCKIIDKQFIEKDTLKVYANYDNDFFLGQIQNFTDTIKFITKKQKIVKTERISADTIKITFVKPLTNNPEIKIGYLAPEGNFSFKTKEKIIYLSINNKKLKQSDTLHIEFKALDYIDKFGVEQYFEENFISVYTPKKQFINKHGRKTKKDFYIIFNDALRTNPRIKVVDKNTINNWVIKNVSSKPDSVSYTIRQVNIIDIDTLKLAIAYDVFNIREEKTVVYDTLSFFVRTTHKRIHKNIKKDENVITGSNMKPVKIEIPERFTVFRDSIKENRLFLKAEWEQGKPYRVKLSDECFTDIYQKKSQKKEIDFTVTKEDYYGKIILSIFNVKRLQDYDYLSVPKTNLDSIEYSVLQKGQLIIQLLDAKNKILKEAHIKNDSVLYFSYLAPEKYYFRMIYDINNNGKWDTGDYLKHIQPEKVIMFPKEITIKSNWDNELDWKLILEK